MKLIVIFYIIASILVISKTVTSKKADKKEKPEWAKKDIRDFTDADMERLLEQWEVSFLTEYSLLNHIS